jgi:hypothetical protein
MTSEMASVPVQDKVLAFPAYPAYPARDPEVRRIDTHVRAEIGTQRRQCAIDWTLIDVTGSPEHTLGALPRLDLHQSRGASRRD